MTEKELTDKAVLGQLKEWSTMGPLCTGLIYEGYSFIPKQIDGILEKLEEEGKILSCPRGRMSTINYISIKNLTSEQRRMYRSENKLLINPIQSSGVQA